MLNNRYKIARAKGITFYNQLLKEDSELLQKHGVRLLSVDEGITIALESELRGSQIHPWNCRRMTDATWDWVRQALLRCDKAEAKLAQLENNQERLVAAK